MEASDISTRPRRTPPDPRLGGKGARLAKQRRWAEEMRKDGWTVAEPEPAEQ